MKSISPSDPGQNGFETVAQLVQRLGDPPADVWQAWCDEASDLGLKPDGANDPVWHELLVSSDGRLWPIEPVSQPTERSDLQMISDQPRDATSKSESKRLTTASKWTLGGVVAVVALGIGFWSAMRPATTKKMALTSPVSPAPNRSSDIFSPSAVDDFELNNESEFSAQVPSTDPIDDIESMPGPDTDTAESTSFSLDALLPQSLTDAPVLNEGSLGDSDLSVGSDVAVLERSSMDEIQSDGSIADVPSIDLMADEDMSAEDMQAESQARDAIAMRPTKQFVTLPNRPQTGKDNESVTLPGIQVSDALRLSFPWDADASKDLYLVSGDDSKWTIQERPGGTDIAVLEPAGDGDAGLIFRWLPAAGRARSAASLMNARLWSDGTSIDLRPVLEAESVGINLQQRDLKLKWDLLAPPPPRLGRLSLDVIVPDELELGWIEPIDEASPNKTRGVGVITLTNDENVAVAFRIDIQTTKTMSMRLRTGARLQSGMPWQWTDRKSVQETLANATNQMRSLQMQTDQVKQGVDQARRIGARRQALILEQRLEPMKQYSQQLVDISQRLAALDGLMGIIADQVQIQFKLSTTWPDREQILLQTIEPESRRED